MRVEIQNFSFFIFLQWKIFKALNNLFDVKFLTNSQACKLQGKLFFSPSLHCLCGLAVSMLALFKILMLLTTSLMAQ